MSNIALLNRLEAEMKAMQERMEKLKNDPGLAAELAARDEITAVMQKHGLNQKSLMSLMGFGADTASASVPGKERRKRALKSYLNPHNEEVVETRGGNHKILKAWKEQYGAEEVESWLVDQTA